MYNQTFPTWHKDLCGFGAFLKYSHILANLSWDVLVQNHQTPISVVLKGVLSSEAVAWVPVAALSGFALVSFWFLEASVHLVTQALGDSSTLELLSGLVGFSDTGVIGTVVLSSLGVWGLPKLSAGSSETLGSTIAVPIFRCLSCLGLIPCLPGKGFLSPCISSHGSCFGLCARATTTALVWWSWFRLSSWNRMLPSKHSKARWFSYLVIPLPISSPFVPAGILACLLSGLFLLLLFILVPAWLHLYPDLAFLMHDYLDNPSLLCCYGAVTQMLLASTLQKIPSTLLQWSVEFISFSCHFRIPTCEAQLFFHFCHLYLLSPVAFFHAMLSRFPCPCSPRRSLRQTLSFCHAFCQVEELWARAGFWIIPNVYKRLFPCPATQRNERKLPWQDTEHWNWTERYSSTSALQFSYFQKKLKYLVTRGLPDVSEVVLSFLQRQRFFFQGSINRFPRLTSWFSWVSTRIRSGLSE